MPGYNRIVKEQQANQVGEHKEGSYRSEKKVVTAPVNPGIEIISQQEKRQQEKQRMVGNAAAKSRRRAARSARVIPQPGQEMPKKKRNGQPVNQVSRW